MYVMVHCDLYAKSVTEQETLKVIECISFQYILVSQ